MLCVFITIMVGSPHEQEMKETHEPGSGWLPPLTHGGQLNVGGIPVTGGGDGVLVTVETDDSVDGLLVVVVGIKFN